MIGGKGVGVFVGVAVSGGKGVNVGVALLGDICVGVLGSHNGNHRRIFVAVDGTTNVAVAVAVFLMSGLGLVFLAMDHFGSKGLEPRSSTSTPSL